ncbi:unnamed protein product [Effrenium voratum]|uniref:Uncharacterized protein n=1 Tax=Effrenium voratum TaxID=2562239 RepID=A0AA36JFJ6_9DINO|nr:unnamed protein product [Effrenium voratum]
MPDLPLRRGRHAGMKAEKIKEESVTQVGHAASVKLECPMKKEQSHFPPVKRRRLRRHDSEVGRIVGCIKSEMKEESLDLHSFWAKTKEEVKEEARAMDAESLKGGFMKGEAVGFCKVEAGTVAKVELAESGHQEVAEGLPDLAAGKRAAFEQRMVAWARQCAEFKRRRATWMPTRPCCPANVFFSHPVAPQEEDSPCVQRLSQKELSCLRRFFDRGHPVVSAPLATGPATKAAARAAATAEEEAGSCMKMWPWMRDLPSHIWAGRGWAYDQSGPQRLSSTGGAEGMQGVQVWESAGTSGQPAAQLPTAAPQSAAASGAVAAWAASNAVKPVRVLCKQQEKQSGVPGISWQRSRFCWQLQWTERDSNGASTRHIRSYTISSFMKDGSDEAAAEASALKAAKAFRAELVAEGRIKEKVRDESLTSEVPGVAFAKGRKKWKVEISGSGGRKIQGGYFTQKAAAEERALELRELHGLQRSLKSCASRARLPVFRPKAPFPGVTWHVRDQGWQAGTPGRKHRQTRAFKPLDHTELELEKAFSRAVAWLKKQRQEMAATGNVEAKGKKAKSKKS